MIRNVFNKKMPKNIDWILIAVVFFVILFGVIAMSSATSDTTGLDETATIGDYLANISYYYGSLQLLFFGLGVVLICIILIMDYNNLRDFSNILYWILVGLLVAVLIFGVNRRGVKGWFRLGSFDFQPAELGKLVMIIVTAKEFAKITEGHSEGITRFRDLLPVLWKFVIPFVLILIQPDWGTAIVYLFTLGGMMLMAKVSWRILGVMGLAIVGSLPVAWLLMQDWQKERIMSFIDPTMNADNAYQLKQAKSVIQNGGIEGKGLYSPELVTQRRNYLPEEHTDFLFAATTEAVGYIGALVIILLYGFILFRLMQLSMRAKDDFGAYIIIGITFMLLFHVIENIGMNIGVLPITGIPLPYFSYGGSSLLTNMIALGLVLNVNMRRVRHSI